MLEIAVTCEEEEEEAVMVVVAAAAVEKEEAEAMCGVSMRGRQWRRCR